MKPKDFLRSKGSNFLLNYPISRQIEIEEWIDEYYKILKEEIKQALIKAQKDREIHIMDKNDTPELEKLYDIAIQEFL